MVEVNDKGFTFEELKELVEGIDSPERLNGVRNLLHTYKGAIRTRAQRELLESLLLKKAAQYVNPETKDAVDEFVESWKLGGKDPDDVFDYLSRHVQGLITRTNAYPVWAYLHNKLNNVRVRTAMGDSYEEEVEGYREAESGKTEWFNYLRAKEAVANVKTLEEAEALHKDLYRNGTVFTELSTEHHEQVNDLLRKKAIDLGLTNDDKIQINKIMMQSKARTLRELLNYMQEYEKDFFDKMNRNYGFWSYIGNQLAFKGMKPAKVIDATDDVPSAKKYIDMISEEMDGPRNFYGIAFAYAHDLITREMFIKYMDARDEYINTLREIKDAIKG